MEGAGADVMEGAGEDVMEGAGEDVMDGAGEDVSEVGEGAVGVVLLGGLAGASSALGLGRAVPVPGSIVAATA